MDSPDIIWEIVGKYSKNHVFGLPGAPLCKLMNRIPNHIRWTNLGIELQDGFCSQFYAMFANSVGTLFTTSGPGIGTSLSSLQNAIVEQNPLVLISTYDSTLPSGDFQQWDALHIGQAITDNVFYIESADDVVLKLHQAYRIARNYMTGALVLIKPVVFTQTIPPLNMIAPPEEVETFTDVQDYLSTFNNQKLLVILGKYRASDHNAIKNFIMRNNIPYVTSWACRVIIPNAQYCGRVGTLGNHGANYAAYHATHILIIGSVSGDLIGSTETKFSVILTAKTADICTIAYNNTIENMKESTVFRASYMGQALNNINIRPTSEWVDTLTNSNARLSHILPRKSELEQYAFIASKVYDAHNLTIPVTTGVGNHWYAIGKYMNIRKSNRWMSSAAWASIGIGMASGIAIYHALKTPVWVFEGDGGFIFSAGNLAYLLQRANMPITVTVFINHIYAAVSSTYDIDQMENANNKTNTVSHIQPFIKMLPNVLIFDNPTDYNDYLIRNPISNTLRFIIIKQSSSTVANNVFEINADADYIRFLKNSRFRKIKAMSQVLRCDYPN